MRTLLSKVSGSNGFVMQGQAAVCSQGIARLIADLFRQDQVGEGKSAGGQGVHEGAARLGQGRIQVNDQQLNGVQAVAQAPGHGQRLFRGLGKAYPVIRLLQHQAEAVLQVGPVFCKKDVSSGHGLAGVKVFC